MILQCKKCGSSPVISTVGAEKLRYSASDYETVTVVCRECDNAWDEKIQTDHGIVMKMCGREKVSSKLGK